MMEKIKINEKTFPSVLEALQEQDLFQAGRYGPARTYWSVGFMEKELRDADSLLEGLTEAEFTRFVEGDEEDLMKDDRRTSLRSLPGADEAWRILDSYFEDTHDWRKFEA